MEFLPTKINDKKVYAGFWKRFIAALLDGIILIPLIYLFDKTVVLKNKFVN